MTAVIHFEAKKYALRQAKDGVIVSFVVHPDDVVAELLSAPIGEHYVVALAPYTEDAPKPEPEKPKEAEPPAPDVAPVEKERRPFHTLPRSTQAAMRCQEPRFWAFLATQPGTRLVFSADEADAEIKRVLKISSKRELDAGSWAGEDWSRIEHAYQDFCGQTTWERPS